MNLIYKTKHSAVKNLTVVVAETCRGGGKTGTARGKTVGARVSQAGGEWHRKSAIALVLATLLGGTAHAQYTNGTFGTATGTAVAIGSGTGANAASASGAASVAIGSGAAATGGSTSAGAIAIGSAKAGTSGTAFQNGAIAIGQGAQALSSNPTGGTSPIAIGATSNANGTGSQVAIGDQAVATGVDAIGIGGHANAAGVKATGNESTAIGQSSAATNTGSVALGYSATSSGVGSVALGGNGTVGSSATGNASFAVGGGASAATAGAIAVGSAGAGGVAAGGAGAQAKSGVGVIAIGAGGTGALTYPVKQQLANFYAASNNTFNGSGDVVFVFGGNNDIFYWAAAVATPGSGVTPAIATAQVQQAATDLVSYVKDMISKNATQLYVFNLPDSSLTPQGVSGGPQGQALLHALVGVFNTTLQTGLAGTTARVIDFNSQLTAVIQNGTQFGFSNTSTPACDATKINALVPSAGGSSLFCSANTLVAAGADQSYLFADGVHPTTGGHRLIASNVLQRLLADSLMH